MAKVLTSKGVPVKRAAKARHLHREPEGAKPHSREARAPSSTAVVLHGSPGSSHSFRDGLPTPGGHVDATAPDNPGLGFSDAPPLDEYESTVAFIGDVLDHAGGHS